MTPTRSLRLALAIGLLAPIGLLALSFATSSVAQETVTQPAPPDPAAAPAAEAGAGGDLSMGEPVDAAPWLRTKQTARVGQTYLEATFGQWDQRCSKTADGSDPCTFYQLLRDKDGNPVAEISLFALPDGEGAAAGATIVVPLETLLTASLLLSIDGGQTKVYPFNFCTEQGCIARVGFTEDEVNQLKKGVAAVLTIVPAAAPDQKVELQISLKGFTAGYEAVKASNAAN